MKAHYYNPSALTETILWGCKADAPDYMEEVLYQCKGYVNQTELMTKGKAWAEQNNYNRLRISVIDLAHAPNFLNTINQ